MQLGQRRGGGVEAAHVSVQASIPVVAAPAACMHARMRVRGRSRLQPVQGDDERMIAAKRSRIEYIRPKQATNGCSCLRQTMAHAQFSAVDREARAERYWYFE